MCGVVRFRECFCNCEGKWTQENVIEFNKIKKNKMHGRNREKKRTDLSMSAKKKNGELTVISPTGENEDE
jgi:ribosomal protein L44E